MNESSNNFYRIEAAAKGAIPSNYLSLTTKTLCPANIVFIRVS